MKHFNARITGWLAFCFIVGLGYMAGAQVRYTPEQEAKMNAAAKKAEEEARNLPAHEKKLESHLLKLVNKMTAENAKAQRDIPKKYGTHSTQIDEDGRIFVRIRCGSAADTLKIRNEIVRHGGKIHRVVMSTVGFPPSVAAWVPYDRMKELAKMTEAGAILTIEPPRARTGDYLTAGDSQLKAYNCDIIVDDIGWLEVPSFWEDDLMHTISYYIATQNKICISVTGIDEAQAVILIRKRQE